VPTGEAKPATDGGSGGEGVMRHAPDDSSVAPTGQDVPGAGLSVVGAARNAAPVPAAAGIAPPAFPGSMAQAGVIDPWILAAAFESVGVILAVLDDGGRFEHLNAAGRTFFKLPSALAVGRPFWSFIDDVEDPDAMAAEYRARLARSESWQHERLWIDDLGDRHRVVWNSTPVTDHEGRRHVVAMAMDVTEQRRAEAALRRQAQTDPLTGLLNRAAFEAMLPDHLDPERGLGCGLLFCDLDGFKAVNDTFGHAAGDAVLNEVARRLSVIVRGGDLVARLGGDEFVVLLPALGALQVRALAARVERTVSRQIRLAEGFAKVGVSVGVRIAKPGEDPATVLADADASMYDVKRRRHRR
jgi:diguanylate cyclase (GGDEF)-like protein/PAS domain S-box-containing protein